VDHDRHLDDPRAGKPRQGGRGDDSHAGTSGETHAADPGQGPAAPSSSEPEARRVVVRPRPRLRSRIGRGAVALAALGLLFALLLLTLRYSSRSLSTGLADRPAPPAPPPVAVEQIERILPEQPPPSPPSVPPVSSPLPLLPAPEPRERSRALTAALRAPLVHAISSGAPPEAAPAPRPDPVPWDSLLSGAGDRPSPFTSPPPWPSRTAAPRSPAAAPTPPRNLLPPPTAEETHLASRRPPASPYLLRAGTWLPVVLTHRVVSDQPGLLRAVVPRDVHDSLTGRHLLVPRGSVLLGSQGDLPAVGQDRLAVVWHRVQFPDGTSLDLGLDPAGDGGLPSASLDGSAGLRGATDHHWGRRFGAAALLSLVGAGLQLSQPERSVDRAVTPGETAAGAAGLELGRLSQSILRQYADLPPTVELRPGARLFAVVTRDIAFDAPYPGR
jgi:type IV secretion system protein TrbI